MSSDALNNVTLALQHLINTALHGQAEGAPEDKVFVGAPANAGTKPVSLMLFHIEPSRELRNTQRLLNGEGSDPIEVDTLALDIRFLVTVHRQGSDTPNELSALGQIISALQAVPTIGDGLIAGQTVRLTPEPYPMEEMSRIWGLFHGISYATSMVYLASPVFVDAGEMILGAPVEERRFDTALRSVDREREAIRKREAIA